MTDTDPTIEFGDAEPEDAISAGDPDLETIDADAVARIQARIDEIAAMDPGEERTEAIQELQDLVGGD